MDHLATPMVDNSVPEHADIPYLCNEQFTYDDLGWLTYPERAGVDVHHLCNGGDENGELLAFAPFLQSWLWFGLLGEAIGIRSRTDHAQRIASKQISSWSEVPAGRSLTPLGYMSLFYLRAAGTKHPYFSKFTPLDFQDA